MFGWLNDLASVIKMVLVYLNLLEDFLFSLAIFELFFSNDFARKLLPGPHVDKEIAFSKTAMTEQLFFKIFFYFSSCWISANYDFFIYHRSEKDLKSVFFEYLKQILYQSQR